MPLALVLGYTAGTNTNVNANIDTTTNSGYMNSDANINTNTNATKTTEPCRQVPAVFAALEALFGRAFRGAKGFTEAKM